MTGTQLNYTLHDYAKLIVQNFLHELGQPPVNLYELVMGQVESALIEEMLRYNKGNLTKSAHHLGLNRATLRKKIKSYRLNAENPARDE